MITAGGGAERDAAKEGRRRGGGGREGLEAMDGRQAVALTLLLACCFGARGRPEESEGSVDGDLRRVFLVFFRRLVARGGDGCSQSTRRSCLLLRSDASRRPFSCRGCFLCLQRVHCDAALLLFWGVVVGLTMRRGD